MISWFARRLAVYVAITALSAVLFLAGAGLYAAFARDNGWASTPPNVRQWFQSLMQPDAPMVSCCGEADAYEADDYYVEGDTIIAIVTDERGDTFPNGTTRNHIEPGTKIRVPAGKVKWDAGNPTGHGIIFLSGAGAIYCYVAPGGV